MPSRTFLFSLLFLAPFGYANQLAASTGSASDPTTANNVTIAESEEDLTGWLDPTPSLPAAYRVDQVLELENSSRLDVVKLRDDLQTRLREKELFDIEAVPLLTQLAATYQVEGDHSQAADYLSRAQDVLHRHEGAHNQEQIPMVYAKALAMGRLGDDRQAEHLYQFAIKLYDLNFGTHSDTTLEALANTASWMRNRGHIAAAERMYSEAVERSLERYGKDSPEMIDLLKNQALFYSFYNPFRRFLAPNLYRRMAGIALDTSNAMTPVERIKLLLGVGDWFLLSGRRVEAIRQYKKAWQLAQQDDSKTIDWVQYFGRPHPILKPSKVRLPTSSEPAFYLVRYRIDKQGRPRKVKLLDSNVGDLPTAEAIARVRYSLYRPAMSDGKPVVVDDYRLRFEFPVMVPGNAAS